MAYQDYMYGKYSYESRIHAQSLDLIQQAKDLGVSDDVIKEMEDTFFSDYMNLRQMEDSIHPWYRSRIENGILQAEFDKQQALREEKESQQKKLVEKQKVAEESQLKKLAEEQKVAEERKEKRLEKQKKFQFKMTYPGWTINSPKNK